MFDVLPAARRLRCHIRGDRLAQYPGPVLHRLRVHGTVAPQRGGGHPSAAVAPARAGYGSVRETDRAAESRGGRAAPLAPLASPLPPPPARDEDEDGSGPSGDGK